MKKKIQVLWYIISDYFTASLSWIIFFVFRKVVIEPLRFGYSIPLQFDNKFWLGLLTIPFFWILIYHLTGYYRDISRRSQIGNIVFTFIQTLIGVIVIFFFLILDDYVSNYKNYYLLLSVLFVMHFSSTLLFRLILTARQHWLIRKRKTGFYTVIIGGNERAVDLYRYLTSNKTAAGNLITGFVSISKQPEYPLSKYTCLTGSVGDLDKIMEKVKPEEVILAPEDHEYDSLEIIFNKLALFPVYIKAPEDLYSILAGKVKVENLYGSPLLQISPYPMAVWQENIKKLFDLTVSFLALLILSPFILFISFGIKITSPGPVIYSHERIGRFGKPFMFYKFRSMRHEAETSGPELSSKNDRRLTCFGRFLRKYRLDEIPNFYNVLKGDLSLVGPRPEREFFILQILEKAPHYIHLQKVKPGITSWGQVRYGYAENVDQMIKRLDYDIMYIKDMSLSTDFKILFYTFMTIIKGRGI